jgi:signal peptidase
MAVVLLAPHIFGYKTYTVISGSMEPTLHVGSLAIVKQTASEKIMTGDIITFSMTGNNSMMATHRVVGIDNTKGTFTTKGDANNTNDGPVEYNRLVGRMVISIPYLGFLAIYIKTRAGILLVAGVFIIMLLLTFIPEILKSEYTHKL